MKNIFYKIMLFVVINFFTIGSFQAMASSNSSGGFKLLYALSRQFNNGGVWGGIKFIFYLFCLIILIAMIPDIIKRIKDKFK